MNACVIFSAESKRRINAYRYSGSMGQMAEVEIYGKLGTDGDEIVMDLMLDPDDARVLGETLLAIVAGIDADEECE